MNCLKLKEGKAMLKEATVIGYVGGDPEIITNKNTGTQFTKFSLGIGVKKGGVQTTDWVDINCNGYFHEFANKYIKKGMRLWIRGYFKASGYLNKEQKLIVNENIYPNDIRFISSKKDLEVSPLPDSSDEQLQYNDVPIYNPADDEVPY